MAERCSDRPEKVQRAVRAAEGWLALGAAQAALDELTALELPCQEQPAVLHQSARVLVALGRLKQAKEAIYRLARIAPERLMALSRTATQNREKWQFSHPCE